MTNQRWQNTGEPQTTSPQQTGALPTELIRRQFKSLKLTCIKRSPPYNGCGPHPLNFPSAQFRFFPLSSFSFHCFLCQPHYGSCFKVIMCLFLHQRNCHRFVLNCLVSLKPRGAGSAFHSTKTSIFSSSEWNRIFQTFQNKVQPREMYLNFGKRFPWSFLSNEISRIFGSMHRISPSKKTLLCCCFFFLTVRGAIRFLFGKKPWVALVLPYLLIELFYIGMPAVPTDGWAGGRSVCGHVITKFSRMGSWPHFLTHGAPLRALRARELRYDDIRLH